MPDKKQTVASMAASIKAKYPQYAKMDDTELVRSVTTKYPQYLSALDDQARVSLGQGTDPRIASLMMKAKSLLPQPERMSGLPSRAAMMLDPTGGALATLLSPAGRQGIQNVGQMAVETGKQFISGAREGGGFNPAMGGINVLKESVVRPMAQQLSMATDASRTPLERAGRALAGAIPLIGPYAATVGERLSGEAPLEGAIETGTELATGAGIAKFAPKVAPIVARRLEAIPKAIEAFQNAPKKLRSAIHEDALNVRDHFTALNEGIKMEAGQQMQAVSKGVDVAIPEGIEAATVRTAIRKDISELIKTKQPLPESLQKILQSKTPQAKSTGPAVGGRTFDLSNVNDLKAFQKMRDQGVFTPEELARVEGGAPKTSWSFEELKQLRTELGHDLWGKASGMPNIVRAAGAKAYETITETLNAAAEKAKLGAEWTQANKSWSQYVRDFWRSPVKNIIKGENASQVFKPLSGTAAEQVARILEKYKERGFDKPGVEASVARFEKAAAAIKKGKASKYDLGILAATGFSVIFGPQFPLIGLAYEAGRFGIPRAQQISLTKQAREAPPLKTLEKARPQ